jgi:membrane glycosyltransferase
VVLAGSALLAAGAGLLGWRVLSVGGLTPVEVVTLALTVTLFAWIGFGFITAVAGFVLCWGDPARMSAG